MGNEKSRECQINVPPDDKNFKTYFNTFHWTRPKCNSRESNKGSVKDGSVINMTCENGFVNDNLVAKSYPFQCTNGKYNGTLGYEDLLCRSKYHKYTETSQISPIEFGSKIFKCDQKGWESYQVKARKPDGTSKHLYTVCFDKNIMRPKFVMQPSRNEIPEIPHFPRNDVWSLDRFGDSVHEKVKIAEGYVPKIQKHRITKAFPEKYDSHHSYPYTFNRGHLAPYADFNGLEEKRASCEYINVAPQWKEFNSNSWFSVERETRDMVKDNPGEWEIYTGTYSSIPTQKGPLYISRLFDKDGKYIKSVVPVPKLYWKIAHNTKDETKSKAFVGINNPELKSPAEFTDKYVVCKPKPDEFGNEFRGNEFQGYVYECAPEELIEKLKIEEKIVK